jgi:hypothetical protein
MGQTRVGLIRWGESAFFREVQLVHRNSLPQQLTLLIPQQWRARCQVKQRHVVGQCLVQDGGHDVRCQRGEIYHSADLGPVHTDQLGDL